MGQFLQSVEDIQPNIPSPAFPACIFHIIKASPIASPKYQEGDVEPASADTSQSVGVVDLETIIFIGVDEEVEDHEQNFVGEVGNVRHGRPLLTVLLFL